MLVCGKFMGFPLLRGGVLIQGIGDKQKHGKKNIAFGGKVILAKPKSRVVCWLGVVRIRSPELVT